MEDQTPVQWSMEDDGSLALHLLADDLVDDNMNVKSASGSGSAAASSFTAPSSVAEPAASGTGSNETPYIKGPMQHILIETFDIPAHLTHRQKVSDLRVAYAKYLAIQDVVERLSQMELAATWTHKKPVLEEIFFPYISVIPGMKEWLVNKEGAPATAEVWGDKKPSYTSLEEILDQYNGSSGKKGEKGKKGKKGNKGKKKQQDAPSIHSSEEEVVIKGKGKGKAKMAGSGSKKKKKAGSSKSRRDEN
ncbi:hypothetical protein PILCRDRAFT_1642 [Piloderma croceum F 1598]|uniref:Uncharacterized protein n=1 Tax=Piloderma croceum (strain F 1598) TaxID=765440 RepID=A0A0C3GF66_PILCF|nr:hypothetical protein PILCRDRAFT_1642 [Piloderma croceum F 1598]